MSIETQTSIAALANDGALPIRARVGRRIASTLAAAMLAGTALVPASAQTFDVNGAFVTVSDFIGAPINGANTILNDNAVLGTLRVNATTPLVFGGTLTDGLGVLAFNKAGAESLTLIGVSSYSGLTTVAGGTLVAGSTTALSPASRLQVNAAGTVDLNGFNNSVPGLTGEGVVTNSSGTAAVLTLDTAGTTTFNGSITGNLGLVKTGAGTQALAGNSSFTNGVELQSGTLRVGSDTALGVGTLSVTGNAVLNNLNLAPAVALGNAINIATGVQLTVSPAGVGSILTLGGVISGDGSLAKLGFQDLRLNGANSYTGGTTLAGGKVEVGADSAFGTGAVAVTSATTLAQSNGAASLTVGNNFNNSQALTIQTPDVGQTFTLSGTITTTRDVIILGGTGGTVALTGSNDLGGGVVRLETGTLAINGAAALNNAANLRFANGTTLAVDGAGVVLGTNLLTQAGNGPVVATIDTRGNDVELSGRVNDAAAPDTLGLVKTGGGTLTLSRTNSSAGTQNVLSGGLVVNSGAVAVTGYLEAASTLNGAARLSAAGTVVGAVALNGSSTLAVDGSLTGNVTVNEIGTVAGAGTITGDVTFANGASNALSAGNGAVADSIGTLNIVGNLSLGDQTRLNFNLGAPGVNDLVIVSGTATLAGILNVTAAPGFTIGNYELFRAGTLLNPASVTLGSTPAGFIYNFSNTPTSLFLQVTLADFYWDGAGPNGDGIINGGSGTWDTTQTNWTNDVGTAVTPYVGNANLSRAFFTAAGGGEITLGSAIAFNQLFFQADGYTVNGAGNAMNFDTGSIQVVDGAVATINADIAGVGGLAKTGPGTLRLGGNNSYTGGTTVDGRVEVSSNTALGAASGDVILATGASLGGGSASVTLANNIVLSGDNSIDTLNSLTLSGTLSGPGGLNKTGGGNLILSGVNSFAGDIDIAGGRLTARSVAALGAGADISAADTTTLAIGPAVPGGAVEVLTKSLSIASGGTVSLDLLGNPDNFFLDEATGAPNFDGTDLTLAGGVNGGRLNIVGGGLVRLQTANAIEGVSVDRSAIVLQNAGGLGAGTLSVNEAALYAVSGGPVTLAQNIVVSNNLYIAGTDAVTLSGTVSSLGSAPGEVGAIVKLGANSLRLDGANSIDNVRLQDGRLIVGNSGALGARDLTTSNFAGTSRTVEAGVDGLNIANKVSVVGPLTVDTAGNTMTISGQVFNTGSIIKTGAGTLILTGDNIYGGSTTVNAGTLSAGSDTAFSTGVVTVADGAVLSNSVDGGNQQVLRGTPTRTIANNIVLGNSSIDSAGNQFVLTGVLQGAGTVAKIGDGTLRLTGNSSNVATGFTGTFDVQTGTLQVDGSIAGNVTVQVGATLAGTGTIFGTTEILGSAIIAPGASPGTLTTGSLLLNASSVLNFELGTPNVIGGALNDRINVLNPGGLRLGGTLNVTQSAGGSFGLGIYNLITYAGALDPTSTALTVGTLAGGFAGVVQTLIPGQVNLVVTSPGTLIQYWDGADNLGNGAIDGGNGTWSTGTNWTGDPDSELNTTWFANSLGVFGGTAGTVTVDGVQQASGLQFVTNGYTLTGGELAIAAPSVFISTSAGVTTTIESALSGAGELLKQGNGTLILSGANSTTGGLTIQDGTLQLNNAGAAGAGAITIGGGTTLVNGGGVMTLGNSVVTLGQGSIDTGADSLTLNGVVSGAGAIIKLGAGALVLNGANSYAGGTSVEAGSVTVGNSLALGTGPATFADATSLVAGANGLDLANALTLAGTVTVDTAANDFTLSGQIGGTILRKVGTGNLILNGNNGFAGASLLDGTVTLGTNTALGVGQVDVDGPVTVAAGVDGLTIANAFVLNDSTVFNTRFFDTTTYTGTISGTSGLTLTGGTIVLNGSNSYAGGTLITDNTTVTVGSNTALGTGLVSTGDSSTIATVTNGLTLANNIASNGSVLIFDIGANTLTLNGLLSGAGAIAQIGTGNLVLNGANSYAGGTQIEGTVTLGNNTALGTGGVLMGQDSTLTVNTGNLVVANGFSIGGNTTVATGGFTLTLNGNITSDPSLVIPGSLVKTGSGTLILGGANNYIGGTRLTAGSIDVRTNTALGSGALTMSGGTALVAGANGLVIANDVTTLGAGTVDSQGFTFSLGGVISGAGSLTKIGGGNLVLGNANSYSGGSFINAGTVTVPTDTALGTALVTMADGTTLASTDTPVTLANDFSIGNVTITSNANTLIGSFHLAGVIGGAGLLTKTGIGDLTLSGANSYSGGTALTEGVLDIRNSSALGTGILTMSGDTILRAGANGLTVSNGIVTLGFGTINTGANLLTLDGIISGAGSLNKEGAGTLVLTAANLYSGGTGQFDGTLRVANDAALGTGGLFLSAGLLQAGLNNLRLANAITLNGGNIDTQGFTFTLDGLISGGFGFVKQGSGTLVLNGANTYSDATILEQGTIQVGTSTALGTAELTMLFGTTLQAGADGLALANSLFTIGFATVDTQGFTFTLNGVINDDQVIVDRGLIKIGAGNLVLNGANLYTGGTNVTAGTVTVGNNSAFGTGLVTLASGTTLANNSNNLAVANAFTIGNATVDTGANIFTINGVVGGAGTLTKIGSGTLVLNAANTYAGGTALNAGTIRVGNNSALSTGSLAMAAGTTLQAGAAGLTLANGIALAGGATVDNNGQVFTLGGVISGTGPLSVIDSAALAGSTLILTGTNSYTGGTVVTGTAVQVAADANLGNTAGGITLNGGTLRTTASFTTARTVALGTGGGTVETATGTTLTTTGSFSGTALTKTGAGTLVLNGTNSYTDGTALNAGQITVGTNSALGTGTLTMAGGTTLQAGVTGLTTANNVVTLGAATINSGASPAVYTMSGVISGAGSITKQGTGILTLSGASTYTGATTVAAGTLNVTGSLVSAVTVNSGAALTGTGTVGALSVLAGASVNPGAPGTTDRATITVTGAASLAGTYTVNVTPNSNDRITAGGALTLGGTLAVVPAVPSNFVTFNQTFTVASGSSRTGTFATTTGLDQFGIAFAPVVEYSTTAATIRLAPQSLVVLGNRFGGISGNQLEVAQAFDRAVAAGYNPQAFFNVYANGGSNLPRTLREMSGEQRAAERRVVLDSSRTIREAALDRLNNGIASMGGQQVSTTDGDKSLTFWLRGAGSWGKAQTNGAATAFTSEQRGILTGLDWKMDGITVGGMFHYTSTDVEYRLLGGSSSVETVGGTVYAGYRKDGGLVVNAGGTVAGSRSNGARAITLPTFQQSLQGRTNGTTYQLFGELAWDLAGAADTRIEPFARLTHVKADFSALTETGGVAALAAAKQGNDVTITNLGMRFGANVAEGKVALNASASWQGTTGDRSALTVIGIPAVGQTTNIRSVEMDHSSLNLTADAAVRLSDTIRFSLGYSGLIGKNNDDHGARATLNFAF